MLLLLLMMMMMNMPASNGDVLMSSVTEWKDILAS
jgi:hypothetical protein